MLFLQGGVAPGSFTRLLGANPSKLHQRNCNSQLTRSTVMAARTLDGAQLPWVVDLLHAPKPLEEVGLGGGNVEVAHRDDLAGGGRIRVGLAASKASSNPQASQAAATAVPSQRHHTSDLRRPQQAVTEYSPHLPPLPRQCVHLLPHLRQERELVAQPVAVRRVAGVGDVDVDEDKGAVVGDDDPGGRQTG